MVVPGQAAQWQRRGRSWRNGARRRLPRLEPDARPVKLHCGEPQAFATVFEWSPSSGPACRVHQRSSGLPHARQSLPYPRGIVIVHSPQVEHHRRTPAGKGPPDQGLMSLDASTLATLRQLRWRAPVRTPRRTWFAVAVAVLLHLVFVAAIWHVMRPSPVQADAEPADHVLRVRFITLQPPARPARPPAPPEPPALPSRKPPVKHPPEPPAKDAMTLQSPTPATTPRPRIYDRNGQPLLPPSAASSATPGYVQHLPQGDARVMEHTDPIKYQATRFDQYFPPPDESAGGAAVRHVVDAVVSTTEVNLPHGVHLKCKTILGIPTPDCMNPRTPPSAKDGDERLSMAPAQPLGGAEDAPKPPSVKACIAMYRAHKPLAWGCPVDTPNRAVDEELRARKQGAARQP